MGKSKGQTCRVCQCTNEDCRQCQTRMGGFACWWVAPDLCSACMFNELLTMHFGVSPAEAAARFKTLTPRESEVFGMMGHGWDNRRIAQALKISPKTLDIHRANVKAKLYAATGADICRLWAMVNLPDILLRGAMGFLTTFVRTGHSTATIAGRAVGGAKL